MRWYADMIIPDGPLLISSCLLGSACRYDGGHCLNRQIAPFIEDREIIEVCPEVAGGLTIPRAPAEIVGGEGNNVIAGSACVIDRTGRDITEAFLKGARDILALARSRGVTAAILKERSPSCGVNQIYDGSFSGRLRAGAGVTSALLKANGLMVVSDEELLTHEQLGD